MMIIIILIIMMIIIIMIMRVFSHFVIATFVFNYLVGFWFDSDCI